MKFNDFSMENVSVTVTIEISIRFWFGTSRLRKHFELHYRGSLVQSQTFEFLKMDQNSVNISSIWKSKGMLHTQRRKGASQQKLLSPRYVASTPPP